MSGTLEAGYAFGNSFRSEVRTPLCYAYLGIAKSASGNFETSDASFLGSHRYTLGSHRNIFRNKLQRLSAESAPGNSESGDGSLSCMFVLVTD